MLASRSRCVNPYVRWGGFAAELYELQDGPAACASDASICKLDSLNALVASARVKPRRFRVVDVCQQLMQVFDECGFTVRESDRLNSPTLDGLIGPC